MVIMMSLCMPRITTHLVAAVMVHRIHVAVVVMIHSRRLAMGAMVHLSHFIVIHFPMVLMRLVIILSMIHLVIFHV